ncbi:MAG: SdiA-regulated domain-containing protein [Ignavibacteria bacterium]|nr:SdiA-regulated domain-containing protein [Ignavibacteria bacterium]
MKLFELIFSVMILSLVGCKRDDPSVNSNNNLPGLTTLTPIEVINLGLNIVEPSGIAYNKNTNSLFVVSDERTDIYEIDFTGRIIRTIPTDGDDFEGIAFTKNFDTIYVVEETRQLVTSYLLTGQKINSFSVNVATNPTKALEGITIDKNGLLFVLNEKDPKMILEFKGTTEVSRKLINETKDISDICYDETDDSFWIVSDESSKVIKTNRAGQVLKEWLLTYDKGEGITFANNKMYIVRDSDAKMYVYNKP